MRGAGAGRAKTTLTAIVHRPNWAGAVRLHDNDKDSDSDQRKPVRRECQLEALQASGIRIANALNGCRFRADRGAPLPLFNTQWQSRNDLPVRELLVSACKGLLTGAAPDVRC